jgi:hypothetical protein
MSLTCKVRALEAQVKAFETGKRYVSLREDTKRQLVAKDCETKRLKDALKDAERRIVDMRKNWSEVYDDIEKEHGRKLQRCGREAKALCERALRAERRLGTALDTITALNGELACVRAALECEKGRSAKLKAQINRDYENSSVPSSAKPNHKKISNSREKTGRKAGGQAGHTGHARKRHVPTSTVDIPAPAQYTCSARYRPTGKTVRKQVVSIRTSLVVTEYATPEFRCIRTGQRVHADFPPGVTNDVNYDGTIKGLAFVLGNYCCVASRKVGALLSDLTQGELHISNGMINGLAREFSAKTAEVRKEAFANMLLAPVCHTDLTSARVNGTQVNVAVCATADAAMYFAREYKGHESVKGTPVEDYQHTLVHDHDTTYYSYGTSHQECLSHVLRYLKDSMENEPGLTWSARMRELLQEMIHYRGGLEPKKDPGFVKVRGFESRYTDILALAEAEYIRNPPNSYYKDGYNLYKRMAKYKESHLLFLHDRRVPADNNLSERLLRIFKRKQKQAISFRSFESLGYLCDSLGVIASLLTKGEGLLLGTAAVFDQVSPPP